MGKGGNSAVAFRGKPLATDGAAAKPAKRKGKPAKLHNRPNRGLHWEIPAFLFGLLLQINWFVHGGMEWAIMHCLTLPTNYLCRNFVPQVFRDLELRLVTAICGAMLKDKGEIYHIRCAIRTVLVGWPVYMYLHTFEYGWNDLLDWKFIAANWAITWTIGFEHWAEKDGGNDHMDGHSTLTGGWWEPPFKWLCGWTQWVMLPLMGRLPEDDAVCHVFVHHRFCNNLDDVESHLWYNRMSPYDFFYAYNPRSFFWRHLHIGQLMYFRRTKKFNNARKVMKGQAFMVAWWAASYYANPMAFLIHTAARMGSTSTFYNGGEWSMHGFSNPNSKHYDPYLFTSTLLAESCIHDAYHAVHHAFATTYNPNLKVTEMEYQHFITDKHPMLPIVFDGMGWGDMAKNIMNDVDVLARNFVLPDHLKGKMTHEEIKEYLTSCAAAIDPATLELTEEELKERKLIGPVHFVKPEADALQASGGIVKGGSAGGGIDQAALDKDC